MSAKGNAESFVEMRGSLKIPDMITGKSAYEIAVMHGFKGAEEEWLDSLTQETADKAEEMIAEKRAEALSDIGAAADQALADVGTLVEASERNASAAATHAANAKAAENNAKANIAEAEAAAVEHIESMAEQAFNVVQEKGHSETAVMSQKAVTQYINKHDGRISRNEKEIANLKAGIPDEDFYEDSTALSIKPVPADAAPYAEVVEIGGMTRKCTNLLNLPQNIEKTQNAYSLDLFTGSAGLDFPVDVSKINILPYLEAGDYYFNYEMIGATIDSINIVQVNTDGSVATILINTKGKFTVQSGTRVSVRVYTNEVVTIKNIMLNPGTTSLPYEPYFEGLRSAPVTEVESVGVNIWDEEWFNGYLNEHTGEFIENAERGVCSKNFTPVIPNETYFFNTWCWLAFYDQNKNFVSAFEHNARYVTPAFTVPSNARFMKIQGIAEQYGLVYNNDLILHKGSTALPYEPYTRHTLPIPEAVRPKHGINADVYDSITWDEDGKRRRRVKCGVVDLGTLDWGYSDGDKRFFVISSDIAEVNSELIMRALCAEYLPISYNEFYTDLTRDKTICRYINYLFVRNLSYTDAATFKAAMSGVMLYYELAEPIITDISDLLPADNIIGVEAGGTVTMVNEYGYDVPNTIVYQLGSEVSA